MYVTAVPRPFHGKFLALPPPKIPSYATALEEDFVADDEDIGIDRY